MHGLSLKISHWRALVLLGAAAICASGQQRFGDVAAGKFLVASRHLSDPNFSETVVLVLHHDKTGTVGLVINRPTPKRLSSVLDLEQATGSDDALYAGGPVSRTGVRALMRSRTKVSDTKPVLDDVYVVTNRALLGDALKNHATVRVYVGYCGWAAGQLDRELLAHAWHVMPGDPGIIFDSDPETVWRRLISRTELRLVQLRRFVGGGPVQTWNRYIVQPEIHGKLPAVVNQMIHHH